MITEVKELAGQLAELVRPEQAGNEVVLTQGNKPVAKLIPTGDAAAASGTTLHVRSFKGTTF
jgi:antitoxin (DNA-binding transcriptional repressor) of toxin-antitoxin stability system